MSVLQYALRDTPNLIDGGSIAHLRETHSDREISAFLDALKWK